MKLAITAISAAAIAFAAPAVAEPEFYGTVGYSNLDLDFIELDAVQLRAGINFNSLFGAEVEGAFGLGDETIGGVLTTELDHQIGAFGVIRTPIAENLEIFGRAGWVDVETSTSGTIGGNPISGGAGDDAGALGVGGNFFFAENHGVRAGYTYYDFDDSADVWEVAYVYRFGG